MTRAGLYTLAFAVVFLLAWASPARGSDIIAADQLVHRYAPAAHVVCSPALGTAYFGLTDRNTRDVQLGVVPCIGLFLLHADAGYVAAFRTLNPHVNVQYAIAVGVVVAIHEAQHAAGVDSEAAAQCVAMRDAPALLTVEQQQLARYYDGLLPGAYHGATC